MVKTSGAAIATVSTLKLAIGPGSFIEMRLKQNDQKTEDNHKKVDEMTRDLGEFEVQQRIKYGKMNQAIQQSDSQRKWLEGQAH